MRHGKAAHHWQLLPVVAALGVIITCVYIFSGSSSSTSFEGEAMVAAARQRAEKESTNSKTRVVISLSSFPKRLVTIRDTIDSLMTQSRPPEVVYLNVPYVVKRLENFTAVLSKDLDEGQSTTFSSEAASSSADMSSSASVTSTSISNDPASSSPSVPSSGEQSPDIPSSHLPQDPLPPIVDELKEQYGDLLSVQRVNDYGPATKLIGALLVEPDADTIIITVDDDVKYHRDTVLGLVEAMERYPNSAATYMCERFPWWWHNTFRQEKEGPCHGFVNAYTGAAYRVGYFANRAVMNHSRGPPGCFFHDDVWISGNLYEEGIRPFLVKPGFNSVLHHRPWTNLSIHAVPRGEVDFRNPCIEFFHHFY
eukprot:TRINITY_DN19215_c0_g1_i1.p1 TRINITY_DN19215_c0_g1~~TRINITY_DN19215_c0_g1_i1.p1  ORF type:complete len:366 (+),score=41.44 TRINITY_DN19215_c0_g1_i1:163-1260(+)